MEIGAEIKRNQTKFLVGKDEVLPSDVTLEHAGKGRGELLFWSPATPVSADDVLFSAPEIGPSEVLRIVVDS